MPLINRVGYDGGCIGISIIPSKGTILNPVNKILGSVPGVNQVLDAVGSKEVIGIEEISWGFELQTSVLKGSGNIQRGFTPGIIYTVPGSMTLWTSELMSWIDQMNGTIGFLQSNFDVIITYRAESAIPLTKVELKECKPIRVTATHTLSSAENQTTSLEFVIGKVIVNGKGIFGEIANTLLSNGLSNMF